MYTQEAVEKTLQYLKDLVTHHQICADEAGPYIEQLEEQLPALRRPPAAVAILVVKDGKILISRRKGNKRTSGQYGPPGGHIEFGESFEDAARKELKEETGLDAVDFRKFEVINGYDRSIESHHVVVFMVAGGVTGEPANLEPDKHEEWFYWDPKTHLGGHTTLSAFADLLQSRLYEVVELDSSRPNYRGWIGYERFSHAGQL